LKFLLLILFVFLINPINAQIIDSIVINPHKKWYNYYEHNLDSAVYWHKLEKKSDTDIYLTNGYYGYYYDTIFMGRIKHKITIILEEGMLVNNKREGIWKYPNRNRPYWYNGNSDRLYYDSIIYYRNGLKVSSQIYSYMYNLNFLDSNKVIGWYNCYDEFTLKIKCDSGQCYFMINDTFNLKTFERKDLDFEILSLDAGYFSDDMKYKLIEYRNRSK
jgi:hypothetical protein